MAENNLTPKSVPTVVTNDWYNDFVSALGEDFVPRNSSGVPTAGKNLGNATYPWGSVYADSLVLDGAIVDVSAIATASHKVVSGKVRSTSNQPAFLTPAGTSGGRSLTISASVTPLNYEVSGTAVTLSTNLTVSSLTAAPSSNNTATLNMASASAQQATRNWGEWYPADSDQFFLTISSAGSEITSLVGKIAGFKVVHGGVTEYFTGYVNSSTQLTRCHRGFFYNSSLAPINRVVLSNGDTITLMKLGWLFLDADGTTTAVTYNEPVYSGTQPSSPASGDYWFDLVNQVWKRYDGAAYATVDRLLIGMFICDTADCVGVRCVDFYANYSERNNVVLDKLDSATLYCENYNQQISVCGNLIEFKGYLNTFSMASHLATSADLYDASEQASRNYYAYVTDTGVSKMSDIAPYWRNDLLGWYHPHNTWRCVGYGANDGSSNFSAITSGKEKMDQLRYTDISDSAIRTEHIQDSAVTTAKINDSAVTTAKVNDGAITPVKRGSPNYSISNGSGTYSYGPGGVADEVTNLARDVVPSGSGKPIYFFLMTDNGSDAGYVECVNTGKQTGMTWRWKKNNVVVSSGPLLMSNDTPTNAQLRLPPSMFSYMDVSPNLSSTNYEFEIIPVDSNGTVKFYDVKMAYFEIN